MFVGVASLRVTLKNEYLGFVWPALFGMFPNAMWWASALIPFAVATETHHIASPWWMYVLTGVGTVAFLFAILVAPLLFPILVLRARQPRGAIIECDDEAITELDGSWRRATIPWSRAEIAMARWTVPGRSFSQKHRAVQVRDRDGDAVITVWSSEPDGAPLARRRVYASVGDMKSLEDVLTKHDHALRDHAKRDADFAHGTPDWSRASDRPRPVRARWGRFGYALAFFAPLVSSWSRSAAIAVACAAAGLLLLRASPVLDELRTIQAALLASTSPEESAALGWRRRAARAEAAIRVAFVALTLASTAAWCFVLPR